MAEPVQYEDLETKPEPAKVEEPPSTEPNAEALSNEDRLLVENLHLRAIALSHQRNNLLLQIQAKEQEFQAASTAINETKAVMAKKYNIDFSRYQIQDGTGAIVPIK